MSSVKYIIVDNSSSCLSSIPKRTVLLMNDNGTSETLYLPMSGVRQLLQNHPRAHLVDPEKFHSIAKIEFPNLFK
jgi:hypothetical protein